VVLLMLAVFCLIIPSATVPVGYFREFIPVYATAMFVISLITSALLFVQRRARALSIQWHTLHSRSLE
jgi:hypothetical protein